VSKQTDLDKVLAIHLLLNATVFLFEDLPETNIFLIENKDIYEKSVKLVEDLTRSIESKEATNYNYILDRLKKMSERVHL
jgi:hypothetical protein